MLSEIVRECRLRSWLRAVAPVAFLWLLLFIPVTIPAFAFVDPTLEARTSELTAAHKFDDALNLIHETAEDNDDPLVAEDLIRRSAEIFGLAGRHGEAAEAWVELANAMSERLGALEPSIAAVWDMAASSFERAGENLHAAEASSEALNIVVASGLENSAAAIVERLKRISASDDREAANYSRRALDEFKGNSEASRSAPAGPEGGFTTIRIYYGTDRARSGSEYPSEFYSGERGQLEMGTALVSIPASHKPGQLEKPDIWSFDIRLDPERHIVLQEIDPASPEDVFASMRSHVETTGVKEAFVFVHGFNVTFVDAARRTAQMAYDMNFDGLPILYSWPSRGSVMSYISDTAVVNLSGRRLSLFLEDVVAKSGATRIHLIAHSMGNRAMTDALELFALRNKGKPAPFDQVLFTAPDLDAGLFAEMAKTIRPMASRLTLYASDKDWALEVSKRLHGDAARAGQGGEGILLAPTFDTVDMTMIGEDMLAHSYFANNASALTDIFSLFWRDASPSQRCGMIRQEGANGISYWHYDPVECDGDALLSTLAILKRGSVTSVSDARAFFNRYIGSTSVDPQERSRLLNALGKLFGG